jgi:hypothetical protein
MIGAAVFQAAAASMSMTEMAKPQAGTVHAAFTGSTPHGQTAVRAEIFFSRVKPRHMDANVTNW